MWQCEFERQCISDQVTILGSLLMQTFDLAEKKADIDAVVRDNTFMAELQASWLNSIEHC
jgi:hypothetical protein